MVSYDNRIYFAASPDDSNRELFVSDGTSSGTFMAADVYPGPEGSFPTALTFVDSTLFFFAFTPATGIELFKYSPQTTGLANKTLIPFKGKVYPQPASSEEGVIYVEWDSQYAWNVANLSDSAGRHLSQIDIKNLSKIQIPITDLIPGMYQLSLSNGKLTSTIMLSIQ
jgi:ELWxxDGT repeat protein